jgi:hypothetical protein
VGEHPGGVKIDPRDVRPVRTNREARDVAPGCRELRVATDDIGIGARIDDVANGLGGQLRNRGDDIS